MDETAPQTNQIIPSSSHNNNSLTTKKRGTKSPDFYRKRWEQFVQYVEDGMTWIQAHKKTYPEFDRYGHTYHVNKINRTKDSLAFKNFLLRRGTRNTSILSKSAIQSQWRDIANFNMALLYEDAGNKDGTVRLREDWLKTAQSLNVINRIVVSKKTIKSKNGDEVIMETTDVIPYRRDTALAKLGKLLGYEQDLDKIPGNLKATQINNTFLVQQIESVGKAIKQNKQADSAVPEITADFIDKMCKMKIVSNDNNGAGQ